MKLFHSYILSYFNSEATDVEIIDFGIYKKIHLLSLDSVEFLHVPRDSV